MLARSRWISNRGYQPAAFKAHDIRQSVYRSSTRKFVCQSSINLATLSSINRSFHRSFSTGTIYDPDSSLFVRATDSFHRRRHGDTTVEPIPVTINQSTNHDELFALNDTPLQHINYFGFDFDFTLAHWRDSVGHLIYESSKQNLINQCGYPRAQIGSMTYDATFPIRGLHFDSNTGFLLKLDQFGKINIDTVHLGRSKVPTEQVIKQYDGITVSVDYEREHLHMMCDLFCLPEICLLADVIQAFNDRKIEFSPLYIFRDVHKAVELTHTSGVLHDAIIANPALFIDPDPKIKEMLLRIREAGRKTFLLTNSSFQFVDAGMRYMLGYPPPQHQTQAQAAAARTSEASHVDPDSWLQLFDVAIFSARKPHFWTKTGQFREIDQSTGSLSFAPVRQFERGKAYTFGSLAEFERLTGAKNTSVLYAGDSHAADLISPSESALWRTVAVVHELERETEVMNSLAFKERLRELLELEQLIAYGQRLTGKEARERLEQLKRTRKAVRRDLLTMSHPHFGSVFRTASHRTKLFFEISRYADVYTSKITNLLNYPLDYCFYAPRSDLPHEPSRNIIMSTPLGPVPLSKEDEERKHLIDDGRIKRSADNVEETVSVEPATVEVCATEEKTGDKVERHIYVKQVADDGTESMDDNCETVSQQAKSSNK